MPRKRMVTRTLTITIATIKCVVTDADKVCRVEIRLPTAYTDKRAVIKAIERNRANYLPDNLKIYAVESLEVIKQKYSMSERDFMLAATPINDKTN